MPWSTGGLRNIIEIISEPGTINNCEYPAPCSGGSVCAEEATENPQHGGSEQRGDCGDHKKQTAELPMPKTGMRGIAIDHANPLENEGHSLRADEESSRPPDKAPLEGLGAMLDQKVGDNLAAAGREEIREVIDEVEKGCMFSEVAGSDSHDDEQHREKCQKEIESDGLRDHRAARKNAAEYASHAMGNRPNRRHVDPL